MSIEVQSGSPLAEALLGVVGPKLAEAGWTSGAPDDNSLTEYIILMLVNGKSQDQIASELAADLLGLPPDEATTHDFARWLFEQVESLNMQINGAAPTQPQDSDAQMDQSGSAGASAQDASAATQDVAMDEGREGPPEGAVYVRSNTGRGEVAKLTYDSPTGPKSMRNASTAGANPRGSRRMLGQLNKAMDRKPDAAIHRIRGGAGVGRINSHGNREPPKGPKSMANRMQNAMNGAPRPGMAMGGPQMPGMNPAMAQGMMNADPQQQMQLLKLLEEQSRMMAQILSPGAQQQFGNSPAFNPAFFPGGQQQPPQQGKSLFERVGGNRGSRQNSTFDKHSRQKSTFTKNSNNQDAMDTDAPQSDSERKDASETACRWQLACTNPACPFGHQSPAAPAGITMDLTDKCSYGAACTNKKCAASHPSPSQKRQHLSTAVDCKFYPNCTNPSCPFKHPTTPPCRNGADCPDRDTTCTFSHSDIVYRYNPCLNPSCPYRHADGQKRGAFGDKVWTREGFDRDGAEKKHVSERQFTTGDDGQEELILPGKSNAVDTSNSAGPAAAAADGMDTETGRDSATEGRASPESLAHADIVT